MQSEVDLDERTPLGPLGFADEMHARFLGSMICLDRIATDARADNVLPRGGAAAIPRNHMIQVQVFAITRLSAVLTGILVSFKDIMSCELDLFFRNVIVHQ